LKTSEIPTIQPQPAVAGKSPYKVPRHLAPPRLKLDQNEGEAPPAELLARLANHGTELMRRYPDASVLQSMIAERFDVPLDEVIVTTGADDGLDRICRAMLCPGRRMLATNPTFEMMKRYAALMGAEVDDVPWWDGPFPVEEFIAGVRPDTSIVAVVSPNNPTGTIVTRRDLERIREAAPHALLLLDHAYVEFADEDLTQFARTLPNTVIVRTLSKAWGLAGLRVGYIIGPVEMINWFRVSGSPYSISRPSIALAAMRLENQSCEWFVAQVKRDRERMHAVLDELGVAHTASQGNFVLISSKKALWIRDALAGLGIAIRMYPGEGGLGNSLRITAPGDAGQTDLVIRSLRGALAPELLTVPGELDEKSLGEVRAFCSECGLKLNAVGAPASRPGSLLSSLDSGIRRLPELPAPGLRICRTASDIFFAREEWLVPVVVRELAGPGAPDDEEFLKAGAACVINTIGDLKGLLR
jgi:histidinol-phosphate aminotransferase